MLQQVMSLGERGKTWALSGPRRNKTQCGKPTEKGSLGGCEFEPEEINHFYRCSNNPVHSAGGVLNRASYIGL